MSPGALGLSDMEPADLPVAEVLEKVEGEVAAQAEYISFIILAISFMGPQNFLE